MGSAVQRYMRTPPQPSIGWYAVLRSEEVVAGQVTRFKFMDRELVAFRDKAGEAVVFDAVCPHFGAHLGHGGRIQDGCLRCPFHGLKFDGQGQCVGGGLYKERGFHSLRADKLTTSEGAANIFLWNGPSKTPLWPMPLHAIEWEGWSKPVTNAGRPLPGCNLYFPSENIIDMTHFDNVHHWDVRGVHTPAQVNGDGYFALGISVTWRAGAQSEYAIVRKLGSFVESSFDVDFLILEPGIAISHATLPEDQGGLIVRSIICITPTGPNDTHIRAVVSVKEPSPGLLKRAIRDRFGVGMPDLLSRWFLAVATADFKGDEMVWCNRKHLERPKPLKEDGPLIAFRRWAERFWPEDYLRDASPTPVAAAGGGGGEAENAAAPS